MSISSSPVRPFAALTAFAVIATGLALAPVVSVGAASAESPSTSIVSKVNSYRSSAKLAKLKTANDVTESAGEYAAALAKAKTTDLALIDFDDLTIQMDMPDDWTYLEYRVSGGQSAVISGVAAKIKAASSKSNKTYVYGDFTHTGVGMKKSGSYTYVFIQFATFTDKLQDSKRPKVGGKPVVGATVRVDMNGWVVDGGYRQYSWVVDDQSVGESNTPLVVTPDLVGKRIWVAVFLIREGYTSVARYSGLSAKVVKGTIGTRPTPKVTGSRVVGSTLTATVGTWSTGTTLAFQWKRNGVKIADATTTSYKQVAADQGKKITFTVTATKPGYTTLAKSSAAPSVTLGLFTAPIPTISPPNENVGVTFTAGVGAWNPKASSYSYQWYRDGAAISKATSKTYKSVSKDRNTEITVRVTGKKTGYKTLAVTSNPHYFGVE